MVVAALIAEAVVIAFLALLVTGLLRSHADVLRALHDLGASIGDPDELAAVGTSPRNLAPATGGAAHDLVGRDHSGADVAVSVTGGDTLLVFLSTSCYTCQPFWSALRDGAETPAGTSVVVVTKDDEPAEAIAELSGDRVPVVLSTRAWAEYEVPGSPHVVFVSGGRVAGEGKAASWDRVLDLVTASRHGDRMVASWLPDPVRLEASRGVLDSLRGDRDNAARIDAELAQSGIVEGDPSLYPTGGR